MCLSALEASSTSSTTLTCATVRPLLNYLRQRSSTSNTSTHWRTNKLQTLHVPELGTQGECISLAEVANLGVRLYKRVWHTWSNTQERWITYRVIRIVGHELFNGIIIPLALPLQIIEYVCNRHTWTHDSVRILNNPIVRKSTAKPV